MIFVEANIGCPSFVLHFDTIFEDFPIVDEGHQLCLLGLQHSHQTVENLVPFLPIGWDFREFFRNHCESQNKNYNKEDEEEGEEESLDLSEFRGGKQNRTVVIWIEKKSKRVCNGQLERT